MSESTENYLKTILVIQKRLGKVRSIDVANELGVSRPSVSKAIKKFREEGLVIVDKNSNLILTDKGLQCATSVLERHAEIEKYLIEVLDVNPQTAHNDSCRLEHILSPETLTKFRENAVSDKRDPALETKEN